MTFRIDGSSKMDPMLSEVLEKGELEDTDVLTIVWMTTAFFLVLYLLYHVAIAWLLEWTTMSVKLSLHVQRQTFPMCSVCAGGSHRTLWQTFNFSFNVPLGEPVRVRFFNTFRSESRPDPVFEDLYAVNRVEIHDCGGIQDIYFEMSSSRGCVKLLCLPSPDYANILLEERESLHLEPDRLWNLILMRPRTPYAAWGKLVLGSNCHMLPHAFWSPVWRMGKSL